MRCERVMLAAVAAATLVGATWVDPRPSPPTPTQPSSSSAQPGTQQAPAAQQAPIEVADWTLKRGRLTLTLHGNGAALDRMRTEAGLTVQVHWQPADGEGGRAAVSELPVGRTDLVPALANEVRRQGYFSWHSWAHKSPGRCGWKISLTLPDGSPVWCKAQQGPCEIAYGAG